MIFQLDTDKIAFPDPRLGDEDGLFAVGGDLSIDRLLLAYCHGIFPWSPFRKEENPFRDDNGNGQIQWWCPMKRFVIFPGEIHISHSMRTLLRKDLYTFSFNKAFEQVIHNCGSLRTDEKGAWLGKDIEEAYTELHRQGFASSVEVWERGDGNGKEKKLVGGLYGVTLGSAFIGESMFSLVPSASKMALIFLASWMDSHGGRIIDCQMETPHLKSMGGRYITYDEYMDILNDIFIEDDTDNNTEQQ